MQSYLNARMKCVSNERGKVTLLFVPSFVGLNPTVAQLAGSKSELSCNSQPAHDDGQATTTLLFDRVMLKVGTLTITDKAGGI